MIAGIFHQGSGLGNQLHRYVMTRVLALDKGTEFGMIFPENFKGYSFLKLDMGVPVKGLLHEYNEKKTVNEYGHDVRGYDWAGLLSVNDFTLIDGEFQGEDYYKIHLNKIRDWLKVEPLEMPEDLCVIGFRGGEYVGVKDLFLPQEYWDKAIYMMKEKYPGIRFEVHTDDVITAQQFFPDFKCVHDIGLNWRSVRYAKHLIIANSSFFIFPALLGEAKEIIAPKFWAGYNKGYWQLKQNQYKRFTYIHHENL
jgi:hypothetical protein